MEAAQAASMEFHRLKDRPGGFTDGQSIGCEAKEGITMPKASPWHSIKAPVHHNNTSCNTGNNIERENLRSGTGGKPLCQECANLNSQGR